MIKPFSQAASRKQAYEPATPLQKTQFGEILNVLSCSAKLRGLMDKQRPHLDSAREIGLGSTSHEFL